MPALHQLLRERMHDAFRPSILPWRHAFY
jgi:hypothetical protein